MNRLVANHHFFSHNVFMKLFVSLIILFFSQVSLAEDLSKVLDACEQSDVSFCQQYKTTKKNVEKQADDLIKSLYLDQPLGVAYFVLKPEYTYKTGPHKIKIELNSRQATYSFEF